MFIASVTILIPFCLHFALESLNLGNDVALSLGLPYVLAKSFQNYRNKCFITAHRKLLQTFKSPVSARRIKAAVKNGYSPGVRMMEEEGEKATNDSILTDKSLDPWKADMADIPGAWRIYYPLALDDAEGLNPNTNLRPSVLFCDISGGVTGPEHPDSGQGSFILDGKESVDIDDGETYVHNRKIAMVILSGKTYSNLRLVLLGRVFYSKRYVLNELKETIHMRAAMIVGQAFIESYRSEELAETLERIKRRITVLDSDGNEVDPVTWEYMPLNTPGSPFRWMHGTDKWKYLGPFTAHRVLGSTVNVPHAPMMFDKYNDATIYRMVDPLKLNKTKYTTLEKVEEETRRVLDAMFDTEDKSEFNIKDQSYINQFYEEMVQLAKTGPDLYKGSMQ